MPIAQTNELDVYSELHGDGPPLLAITHPTLVCAGEYDDIAPVANSELLVDRMPNATLRVFDGGHILLLQDRSSWSTIIEFLGGAS